MTGDHDILLDADAIAARVAELGTALRGRFAPGDVLHVVGVLKGSVVFVADLLRAIPGPVTCDFLRARSYQGTASTGEVELTHDLGDDIAGRHVLLVEDIVDTGLTLARLRGHLRAMQPRSLTTVSLLDKPSRRQVAVAVDMVGFTIEDHFVVGYGLDVDGLYRNLPYVAVLRG